MSKKAEWLDVLWPRVAKVPRINRLMRAIETSEACRPVYVDHIAEPAQAFWLGYLLFQEASRGRTGEVWILCRDVTQQERLANELPLWWPGETLFFPQHEAIHVEDAVPDAETASDRLQVLHALGKSTNQPRAVLLHHESLEETVPSRGSLAREERRLQTGGGCDLSELSTALDAAGFERTPQVYERGQFSVRGGIVDVFPWQTTEPYRIEFFDDQIESIRVFDIDSQTSSRQLEQCTLLLKDASSSFSRLEDYIQSKELVISVECADDVAGRASVRLTELATKVGPPPPWTSRESPLGEFTAGDFVLQETRREAFVRQLESWAESGWTIRMFFNNQGEICRFEELIPPETLERTGVKISRGRLGLGFTVPSLKLAILSDAEIFGRYQHGRAQRLFQRFSKQRRFALETDSKRFQPDDYVVHVDYGIGRFQDIEKRGENGRDEEVLVIEYADEAKLYVPMENAHLVSRYVGVGKSAPKLSKLGSGRWLRIRRAAERAIMEYAGELLILQAQRQTYQGFAHVADTKWQWEFENAFLFKETRDQLRAIADTKSDMEGTMPMDRLICGDVGFGKTEVAIRAAFKAVMSGCQVAMLVPTTVLAQQHFHTFSERMSDYPIRIEHLSRFRTQAEQRSIVQELAEGAVDIVIGTHRLISKDVQFKKLGLVIIDEEQRFGVRHKERLKERFQLVDVLTLSATPIPRTLYMSLMGVRDMTTIETPPPNRLPVQTTICGFDERIARDAIERELKRDGQVYYLHNRIETIERVALRLSELCPGARIGIGHGQMDKEQLEGVMTQFVDGKLDVLVCTTIIESGIDIPNANTMIIDRADRFGLADLYQLRGRVGRAQKKAYAILMLPRHVLASGDARKRINAIRDYSSLGAGFKVAMRDLEIRGAGNLLGTQQSGQIMAVGFDLYCQLLKQSINSLQGRNTLTRIEVLLRIDFLRNRESAFADYEEGGTGAVPAFIPAAYIEEPSLRILAYRQVAEATTRKELETLETEWRDRFGPLPNPVKNLLSCTRLKIAAALAGITAVEIKDSKLMLTKRGDYIMIDGRFPRLKAKSNVEKLIEAEALFGTLSPATRNIRVS